MSRVTLYALKIPVSSPLILGTAFPISAAVYIILLRALSVLPDDDRAWIYRVFRIKKKIK